MTVLDASIGADVGNAGGVEFGLRGSELLFSIPNGVGIELYNERFRIFEGEPLTERITEKAADSPPLPA